MYAAQHYGMIGTMSSIKSNISTGGALVPAAQRALDARKPKKVGSVRERFGPPKGRGYQNVPHIELLEKLINRALEALQNGIYWERGSIVNIIT